MPTIRCAAITLEYTIAVMELIDRGSRFNMATANFTIKSVFGIPAVWIKPLARRIEYLAHVVGSPAGDASINHGYRASQRNEEMSRCGLAPFWMKATISRKSERHNARSTRQSHRPIRHARRIAGVSTAELDDRNSGLREGRIPVPQTLCPIRSCVSIFLTLLASRDHVVPLAFEHQRKDYTFAPQVCHIRAHAAARLMCMRTDVSES